MDKRNDSGGHVFISYVRENTRAVNRLQKALELVGVTVWRDTANLWPGEDWRAKIRNAIVEDALVFIACFSRESNARKSSYQNEELGLAIEQMRLRRPGEPWLIPVRFDNSCYIPDHDIGMGRTLASIHRADLFGRRSSENTKRLVDMVLRILGMESREPSSATVRTAVRGAPIPSLPVAELKASSSTGQPTLPAVVRSPENISNAYMRTPAKGVRKGDVGSIVTFYSFSGGTGKTMALANVAWILAANGYRVLAADWDLESPGLHRFFQPFMDTGVDELPGIVDFIRGYAWEAAEARIDPDALYTGSEKDRETARHAVTAMIDQHAGQVKDYAIPLNWQFPDRGMLHFLSSGKQGNGDYQATLGSLDWDNFYDNLHGGQFFDALRDGMKRDYDYVLIDSRTGLSDVADICTVHLPDVVVDCFTLATQGIEGAALIAKSIQEHADRDITILPVPMRIDHSQNEKVEAGLAIASSLFANLPAGMSEAERHEYWSAVEVPYRPSYAYEETLATIGDRPGSQAGLLPSYERIVSWITGAAVTTLPPCEEWIRLRTRLLFSRTPASSPLNVVIDFSPEVQLWVEWIAAVLGSAEITVRLVGEAPAGGDEPEVNTQTAAVVSESYLTRIQDTPPAELPDVLISVTESRLPHELAKIPVISLVGLTEAQAVVRLIDVFKGERSGDAESGIAGLRYPGR